MGFSEINVLIKAIECENSIQLINTEKRKKVTHPPVGLSCSSLKHIIQAFEGSRRSLRITFLILLVSSYLFISYNNLGLIAQVKIDIINNFTIRPKYAIQTIMLLRPKSSLLINCTASYCMSVKIFVRALIFETEM